MNLEEIKALKDHAANGGFTSPHKVSALIALVERLRDELDISNQQVDGVFEAAKQEEKRADKLQAKLTAIRKDAEQLTNHIAKMVKLSQNGKAYQVTENSVVTKYSSALAKIIKEEK